MPPPLEDDGDSEIGKGVGVKEDTKDGLENVGIVVDAVENCESDEVAVLAGVEVSFALKREIDTC